MATNRYDIGTKFETGDVPSQADFKEIFDSFVHKDEDKATVAMVEAGIDDEHYVTPALLRLGLQNIGAISGGGNLPFKEHFENFNGTFIILDKLPIESSVKVFKNGQLLLEGETGDYTINYETAVVTFPVPVGGRNIEIDYWYKNTEPVEGLEGSVYVDLTTDQTIAGNKLFTEVADFIGVRIDNGGSNRGLHVINNGDVQGVFIRSTDSGDSLVINDSVTATGTPLQIQKDGVTKFSVDGNGQATATSFVKSGGTSDEVLLGDGTTTSLSGLGGGEGGGNVVPVSAIVSGIVDNTSLQELGGVDKLINGVRVGKGEGELNLSNTAVGNSVLGLNVFGDSNTGIGYEVLKNNTDGYFNTGIGTSSLKVNTTGENNTSVGAESMLNNTEGFANAVLGAKALRANVFSGRNSVVGASALINSTSGGDNVSFGYLSGSYASNGTTAITTIGTSVMIGSNTKPFVNNGTNEIVIGYNANGAGSNTTTIGNTSILKAKINGQEILAPLTTNSIISSEATGKILITKEYLSTYAPLASPVLTGTPIAPTAAPGTNTTQLATTAFVTTAVNTVTPTLQNVYDNGVNSIITTSTAKGAVTIKRGSAADTDVVFKTQRGNGSDRVSILGTGKTTILSTENISLRVDASSDLVPEAIVVNASTSNSTGISIYKSNNGNGINSTTTGTVGNVAILGNMQNYNASSVAIKAIIGTVATGNGIVVDHTNSNGTGFNYVGQNNGTNTFTVSKAGVITAAAGSNSNEVVVKSQLDLKANIDSPVFTGIPTAPTASLGTNTTQLATTAFVLANAGTTQPVSATVSGVVDNTSLQELGGVDKLIHGVRVGIGGAASSTVLGNDALSVNTAENNTAIGYNALRLSETGAGNTAIGGRSLSKLTVGTNNTSLGFDSSRNLTTGNYNTSIGYLAGGGLTTGEYNIQIGYAAVSSNSVTTGSNNIIISSNLVTGIKTGSDNVIIGAPNGLSSSLAGNIILATGSGSIRAQHDGTGWSMHGVVQSDQFKLSDLNTAPSSSTDTGALGEIRITSGYIYVCIDTDTWVRSALSTW